MRIALDTNRYVDFRRGEEDIVRQLEEASAVFLPFIVLAELRAGFAAGKHTEANERALRRFLFTDGVQVLWPDEQTTQHYGLVYLQLKKQGTPVPSNDIWIGALAIQHHLVLASRDGHFEKLPQIVRI